MLSVSACGGQDVLIPNLVGKASLAMEPECNHGRYRVLGRGTVGVAASGYLDQKDADYGSPYLSLTQC